MLTNGCDVQTLRHTRQHVHHAVLRLLQPPPMQQSVALCTLHLHTVIFFLSAPAASERAFHADNGCAVKPAPSSVLRSSKHTDGLLPAPLPSPPLLLRSELTAADNDATSAAVNTEPTCCGGDVTFSAPPPFNAGKPVETMPAPIQRASA